MAIRALIAKVIGSSTVWVILILGVLWGAYQVVRPTEPGVTAAQMEAVEELSGEAAGWAIAIELPRARAVFLPLERDPFAIVSDPLRHAFWRSDRFNLVDYSLMEKFCRFIHWKRPTVGSRRKAAEIARRRDCQYAIWGRLREFSDVEGLSRAVVLLEVIDAANASPLAAKTLSVQKRGSARLVPLGRDAADGVYGLSFATRLLIWIAVTLLLPLASYPFSKQVLAGDSNAAILALLITLVAVSTGVAYLLFAFGSGTIFAGLILLMAFTLALFYNWHALDKIKTTQE